MTDVSIVTNETDVEISQTVVDVSIVPTEIKVELGNSGVPGSNGAPGSAGAAGTGLDFISYSYFGGL